MNKEEALEVKHRLFNLIGIEAYNIIKFRDYTDYEIVKTLRNKVESFSVEIDELNKVIEEVYSWVVLSSLVIVSVLWFLWYLSGWVFVVFARLIKCYGGNKNAK